VFFVTNKQLIGKNIRNYRQLRNFTQESLALALNCSPSTIAMYETGQREPNSDTIEAIADILNVDMANLQPNKRVIQMDSDIDKEFFDIFMTLDNDQKRALIAQARKNKLTE
jgi:transcriptional regulator with XRE-family HTH domain